MRQIYAYVDKGKGVRAREAAEKVGSTNIAFFPVTGAQDEGEMIFIEAENHKIEKLIGELQKTEDISITFFPQGIISLKPPASKAPDQAVDVNQRSPIEIFLSGLQSIGSWKGFLGYAFAAGIVVWIGLYTNTIYLLVAAMLIAPFAGPAMTLAMGTARGDKEIILHSLIRYISSLVLSILTAALFSKIMGQEIATELMIDTSKISSTTSLLALISGAAGALNLCQSERNSLVTAAGPGMLIAASLAPPAGVIGMAGSIGEWDMVKNGFFLLILQLIGINLSGALVFYLFGLKPKGIRYDRGQSWLRTLSFSLSFLFLLGILSWQFSSQPDLQRSSRSRNVAAIVKEFINKSPLANPVEVNVRFTRADIKGQNTLLITTFVQNESTFNKLQVKKTLTKELKALIHQKSFNLTPLIEITVLE
jgi:uncharacterized hydrophobic protein (TIGR00341 family)